MTKLSEYWKSIRLTGEVIGERKHIAIYPASHYVTTRENMQRAAIDIEAELDERWPFLKPMAN